MGFLRGFSALRMLRAMPENTKNPAVLAIALSLASPSSLPPPERGFDIDRCASWILTLKGCRQSALF